MGYWNSRGNHNRNWVHAQLGYGYYTTECEVISEVKHPESGIFGVIDDGDRYAIIWRPNRNVTRSDIKVMWDEDRHSYVKYNCMTEAAASITERWFQEFKLPEKHTRYRVRDAQKSKVYRWEHEMARACSPTEAENGGGGMPQIVHSLNRRRPEEYLRAFLKNVCDELGEKEPELKFRTGGRCSYGSGWSISLLPVHKTQLILLHELSHTIHSRWQNREDGPQQAHGKEFVGIFGYLLIRFGGVREDAFRKSLVERKVKCEFPVEYYKWLNQDMRAAACST